MQKCWSSTRRYTMAMAVFICVMMLLVVLQLNAASSGIDESPTTGGSSIEGGEVAAPRDDGDDTNDSASPPSSMRPGSTPLDSPSQPAGGSIVRSTPTLVKATTTTTMSTAALLASLFTPYTESNAARNFFEWGNDEQSNQSSQPQVGGPDSRPTATAAARSLHQPRPRKYTCPGGKSSGLQISMKSADGKKLMGAIHKYSRYVAQFCNTTGMMQMHVSLPVYLRIIQRVTDLLHVKRGAHVLDFGSGCGTFLNVMHMTLGTRGLGVDLTREAVAFARPRGMPNQTFCHAEGLAFLKTVPSASFDHVVSWSALHHIRRKMVQCEAVQEMVRVVKPGGSLFVGHLRGEMTQRFWEKNRAKCPLDAALPPIILPSATSSGGGGDSVTNSNNRSLLLSSTPPPRRVVMNLLPDHHIFGVEQWKRNKFPSLWIRRLV